jgi:hypothetical protein
MCHQCAGTLLHFAGVCCTTAMHMRWTAAAVHIVQVPVRPSHLLAEELQQPHSHQPLRWVAQQQAVLACTGRQPKKAAGAQGASQQQSAGVAAKKAVLANTKYTKPCCRSCQATLKGA